VENGTKIIVTAVALSISVQAGVMAQEVDEATITVTATREADEVGKVAASVGRVGGEEIERIAPSHPSEIVNRIPGVHVNVTGGEGHMTAIRQPISTQPLYLYLEDGIPTRSTGFFNHNALYEINLPQAGAIEVLKGPGTALYGSDAIGGVINVVTRPAPLEPEADVAAEYGSYGWRRLLLSGGNGWESDGVRADLNMTHSDGWRDNTNYDRYSTSLRWDHDTRGGASLKTVASLSRIDQQTAGSSRLLEDDYLNNPELNYTPISYRKVDALRLSTAYETETADSLLSVIPYVRSNSMDMLPNWSLSYDPVVYETKNNSVGLLAKYRHNLADDVKMIIGVDVDYSPGSRYEQTIVPIKVGNIYTDYTIGSTIYDYDVIFTGISPYLHLDWQLTDALLLQTGVRSDQLGYDYDNHLTALDTGSHRRPADTSVSYQHLSPKLGLVYAINARHSTFISYRHAFRAPSESQLFRQGRAVSSVDLEPVKVDSYELGVRGNSPRQWNYSVSLYAMEKRDDILTYRYPDGSREVMNAGVTRHKGIELGYSRQLLDWMSMNLAWSVAEHVYDDWQPNATTDYSGNEMPSAPQTVASAALLFTPQALHGGSVELQWERLGSYWMDDENSYRYGGHDLYHLRTEFHVDDGIRISARVMNLADRRYATAAQYSAAAFGNPEKFEYAPGMPRSYYLGVSVGF